MDPAHSHERLPATNLTLAVMFYDDFCMIFLSGCFIRMCLCLHSISDIHKVILSCRSICISSFSSASITFY